MATLKNQTVKDVLQSGNKSKYEQLMSVIRDSTLREKNKKEEIGVRNDDRLTDNVFDSGKIDSCSLKDIIYPEKGIIFETPDTKDKQNGQLPWHNYIRQQPFGKPIKADKNGNKMKKLIYSISECSPFQVNKPILLTSHFNEKCHSKIVSLNDLHIYEALQETPVSTQMQEIKACMSYLNKIRLQLKKHDFERSLFTLRHHFNCIDKAQLNTINLTTFMQILRKIGINLDRDMLCLVLEKFGLANNDEVYYDEASKLLCWKYETPALIKPNDLSKEWQCYRTVYQELISLKQKCYY